MTIYLNVAERPLSATEQTIWATDEVCSMNFLMHFELHGDLAEGQLRIALAQAQNRHPLLRMRLVEEGKRMWFRAEGAGPIPLRIVDGPVENLAAEAEYEVQARFDCQQGPLARCVWIRHAADHATFLVTFHHLIGDGISGSFLVRDILRALANERLEALPLAESLDGHIPPMARGVRGFGGTLRLLMRRIRLILRKGRLQAIPAEKEAAFEERRARLVLMRLEPELLEALATRARAEGTTVHGALSAAIALSGVPEIGTPRAHIAFCSPVNMRDRFVPPIGDDIGFYVAVAWSSHLVGASDDFWRLAREMKQGLTEAIEIGQPFFGLSGIAPWFMFRYRKAGGGLKGKQLVARSVARVVVNGFALTNIGRVKLDTEYGPFRISALGFVASLSVLGSNAFTAASLGKTLCLNSIVMEPVISHGTQIRIAERVRATLESAVAKAGTAIHSPRPSD